MYFTHSFFANINIPGTLAFCTMPFLSDNQVIQVIILSRHRDSSSYCHDIYCKITWLPV